ncbi:translation initiation factor IF-2 N-terminal domain-containing protein [Nocardia sienata]|uniref:translation initiation factor IF-2 N-terminal domain-containing protein n=1 Tax=Nocardia sienata TaxID=248552 RepID=UPI0007A4E9DE|nr:translation initiation factor IF-2 N-terminal domain-containing protein [Nocardia sienata]
MADQEPLDTTSQDDDHLPERIRVHALAKRLGVTSKRILAKLSELGTEARSPQSSVDRAVAESVRESLTAPPALAPAEPGLFEPTGTSAGPVGTGDAAAPPATEVAAAAPAEPRPAAAAQPGTGSGQIPGIGAEPVAAGAAEQTPQPTAEPGAGAQPATAADSGNPATEAGSSADETDTTELSASAEISAAAGDAAASGTPAAPVTPPPAFTAVVGLFASPVPEEPASAEPIVFESAVVAAPLFLSPDAAAAEQPRRRRKPEPEPEPEPDSGAEADSDAETGADSEDRSEQGDSDDQPRRRRRGRRGRGRGRGEQATDSEDVDSEDDAGADAEQATDTDDRTAEPGETDESEADESGDGGEDSESGSSRRRRRRRRRKVAGEAGDSEPADDDPPNTVVHEREPRNKTRTRATVDEVQGITGSTRLEAKRQRRRDGREAGRRRPPILTESEFLARREAVDRVMVVREKEFPGHPSATQVAVLEDNILVEHFVTSTGSASMVGNVYLGKVQNVLPSMEAAFVDIGRGRNGVLYAGEVNWEAAGLGGKERKIEQALKPGDQVLVQVSKDPVGHKGARLTTQISLAGRFLVYVPGGTSTGISRKLPDTERKRLKEILREIVPADAGVIIRTASEGVSEAELTRDVERLQTAWRKITAAADNESNAPKTLYEEPDLLVKVVRDLFNEDFSKLVIEGERSWNTVENYIGTVAPDLLARVCRHENNGVDVFETYRIDEQLAKALDRKVWLPSGGTLVIDRTEAMTVIDVNTGKFTGSGGGNLEETVTRNNLEAAEEIVRQMRLRDIGGMIVVDFIDMVLESNRDLVLRRLTEALGRDRTRHQVSEVTSLGLVQMTRKKLGTGLVEAFSSTCEHCHGRGILVHSYPVEPSGSDEGGAGRGRESGSRRRRNRDKAAATPPAPQPSTPELPEEDAAAKRAHPVALAMAAHHPDTDQGEPAEATKESTEQAAPQAGEPATVGGPGGSGAAPEAVAAGTGEEGAAVAEPRRRRTRVRRSAGAAGTPAQTPAAALNGSGTATEPGGTEPAATEATAPEQVASEPAPTEATAAEQVASAPAAAEATATERVPSEAVAAEAAATEPDAAAASGTHAPEPETPQETPVGADTEEASPVAATATPAADRNGTAATANGAAHAAESAPAPAPAAAPEPAAASPAGDGGTETRSRRRRVARSTSAPAADSTGAVFVLSAAEQPAAPVTDFTAEPPEVEVPVRRARRRAAGRPSGPPVDEQN